MLADGESLIVRGDDVLRIYELLLELCTQPGALSTAALLIDTSRLPDAQSAIDLNSTQSTILREALARLDAADAVA